MPSFALTKIAERTSVFPVTKSTLHWLPAGRVAGVLVYAKHRERIAQSQRRQSQVRLLHLKFNCIQGVECDHVPYSFSYQQILPTEPKEDRKGPEPKEDFEEAKEPIPPVAADDSITTLEDTAVDIDVLTNDSDPATCDTELAAVRFESWPENGAILLNDDGTIRYTPDDDYSGKDTFQYVVSGCEGEDTATGKFKT